MTWFRTLLVVTLIAVCPAQAKDRIVQNAEADIQRFEQQAQGLTPARKSQARRILRLLELSHSRLQSAGDHNTPDWQAVNQRYVDLRNQLQGLSQTNSATSAATAVPVPQSQSRSSGNTAAQSTQPRPLVSGERVRVRKLTRDMHAIHVDLNTQGPSAFQDDEVVARYRKRMQQFATALKRYPQLDDPDVQAARQGFMDLRTAVEAEFKRAEGQLAALGNVQQRLTQLQSNFGQYPVPAPLQIPFTGQQAKAWVDAASKARTVAEHNHTQLGQIAPLAYLPNNPGTPQIGSPFDADDVDRMQRYAAEVLRKIQANYATMAQTLKQRMAGIEGDVLTRYQKDPEGDSRYQFIGEGAREQAMELFDESMAIPKSYVALEAALGRDTGPGTQLLAALDKAREDFLQKREQALASSRLPQPESGDADRLAIATRILQDPAYAFGEHGRIVLTTPEIVSRERKDSEIDFDDAKVYGGKVTLSGTETTWTYRWEEFKFAVPLKESESDTWHIWWITAKNYSSGGDRTPLNRWVSGAANKGNEILPENH
jgi:hypothetical protein